MRHVLDGCERADSLVVNPHKWMFVPLDLSVLYTRRPEVVRAAFSLAARTTCARPRSGGAQPDGLRRQPGPALPRAEAVDGAAGFGHEGLAARIRAAHPRWRSLFGRGCEATTRFELMAPAPFSVVCFRARFASRAVGAGRGQPAADGRVNASGEVYLSHTRLHGRTVLRLAVGNLRTEERHVRKAWTLLQQHVRAR